MFIYYDLLYNLHWAAITHIFNRGVCVYFISLISAVNLQIAHCFTELVFCRAS